MTHRKGALDAPPEFHIGHVDHHKTHEHALHKAAAHGNKKPLKKALAALGNDLVDCKNDLGQTALFAAAYYGKVEAMTILLEEGAHPNERCLKGQTPMHAACYHGTVLGLSKLIEHGGDLRLHDDEGHKPHDFAFFHQDRRKRKDLLEYIEKARLFAMTGSGRDILMEHQSETYLARYTERGTTGSAGSVAKLFKTKSDSNESVTKKDSKMGFESIYNFVRGTGSAHSLGFGTVYVGKQPGAISTIPLIPDTGLVHDEYGLTFNNGAFMVMESMFWDKTHVTVKRLHHKPIAGGVIDLLIEESDFASHLRHPNILLLMGLCQTHNLDSIVLLYERVRYGSLFFFLHERFEHLTVSATDSIMMQIADALVYTHSRGIVHCSLTSHAVQLVGPNLAKLCNFEYAVNYRDAEEENRRQWTALKKNKHANAVCNWMAPEMLGGTGFPCEESDMYSYCAVLWEMLKGEIPWSGLDGDHVIEQLVTNKKALPVDGCPDVLCDILNYGLSAHPRDRKINFEEMRDLLHSIPKKITNQADSNNHNNSSLSNVGDLFYIHDSPLQPFTTKTMNLRCDLHSNCKHRGEQSHTSSTDSSLNDYPDFGEEGNLQPTTSGHTQASVHNVASPHVSICNAASPLLGSPNAASPKANTFNRSAASPQVNTCFAASPLVGSQSEYSRRVQSRNSPQVGQHNTNSPQVFQCNADSPKTKLRKTGIPLVGLHDLGQEVITPVTDSNPSPQRPVITKYRKANMISPVKKESTGFLGDPVLMQDDPLSDRSDTSQELARRQFFKDMATSPFKFEDRSLSLPRSNSLDNYSSASAVVIKPPKAPRGSVTSTSNIETTIKQLEDMNSLPVRSMSNKSAEDDVDVAFVKLSDIDSPSVHDMRAVSVQTSHQNMLARTDNASKGTQASHSASLDVDNTNVSTQTSNTALFNRRCTGQQSTVYGTLTNIKTTPRTKKWAWATGPYRSPEQLINTSITSRNACASLKRRSISSCGSIEVESYKPASHRTSLESGLIVRPHSAMGSFPASDANEDEKRQTSAGLQPCGGVIGLDSPPAEWSPQRHCGARSDSKVSSLITRFQSQVFEHKMKQAVLHGKTEMVEQMQRQGSSTPNLSSRTVDLSDCYSNCTRNSSSPDTVIRKFNSVNLTFTKTDQAEPNMCERDVQTFEETKAFHGDAGKSCDEDAESKKADVTTVHESVCESDGPATMNLDEMHDPPMAKSRSIMKKKSLCDNLKEDPYYSPSEGSSTIRNANSDTASNDGDPMSCLDEMTLPKRLAADRFSPFSNEISLSSLPQKEEDDPEDFFIDDEICPDWEKRVRLQLTMTPGTICPTKPPRSPLGSNPTYGVTRRSPHTDTSLKSDFKVSDMDFTTAEIVNKSFREQFLEEYCQESNAKGSSNEMKHLTSTPISDDDNVKVYTKVIDPVEDRGYSNCLQVITDDDGRHVVKHSKTNLETGQVKTYSEETVYAPHVQTELTVMGDYDNFV